jgi:hypothetical protein
MPKVTDSIGNLSIATQRSPCFTLYNQPVANSMQHTITGMLVALYHLRQCRTGCCNRDVIIWIIRKGSYQDSWHEAEGIQKHSREEQQMKNSLVVRVAILLLMASALSGCLWVVEDDYGHGGGGGGHHGKGHDNGEHRGDRH